MTCGFGRGVFHCDIKIHAIYYNDYITLSVRKLTLEDFQDFSTGRNLAIDCSLYTFTYNFYNFLYFIVYLQFIHFYIFNVICIACLLIWEILSCASHFYSIVYIKLKMLSCRI